MANRTPESEWAALFNPWGGGLVHMELYEGVAVIMAGQTFLEWFAATLLLSGTHANRPAATAVPIGAEYYETDTANRFKSNGTTWIADGQSGSGGFPVNMPGCQLTASAALTIPNTGPTPVQFNTEEFDPQGMHDNSTNNSRITIAEPGTYLLTGTVNWDINATGGRVLAIMKNGTNILVDNQTAAVATYRTTQAVTTLAQLTAGDYVELTALQDTAGNLNIVVDSLYRPIFAAQLLTT